MRLVYFVLLVTIITFAASSSGVVATENAIQVKDLAINADYEGRRYLKGSTKTTELNVADEERVGATTPSLKQFFGLAKLPKISIPGTKYIKTILKKLADANLAKKKKKFYSNPNAYGY
ncbi:Secreted RxLR effector peptide protein [Phytophthora palmivora]|uniref:RxLR effector protein n=1 Tax=Phytophthora palmivora TaxID=4796 RepID=A0A2P4YLS1_9STRA|nr:Secreted RxLR effector peptide protein [Phytophthora palmivora]